MSGRQSTLGEGEGEGEGELSFGERAGSYSGGAGVFRPIANWVQLRRETSFGTSRGLEFG